MGQAHIPPSSPKRLPGPTVQDGSLEKGHESISNRSPNWLTALNEWAAQKNHELAVKS